MQQYNHTSHPIFIHYNLPKQIPSGIFLEFTWGHTKQVAAYPTPPSPAPVAMVAWNITPETVVLYPDPVICGADNVEADMLANADDNRWTIYLGSDEVCDT